MIAKSMGIPAQDVVLGEYTFEKSGKTVPACACGDIRIGNETLYEIDKQELSIFVDERDNKETTFEFVNEIFCTLKK